MATNGLELMDGGNDSPRGCRVSKMLPCIDLEREEHVRDERLVRDLCGNGVVKRNVCESHFRRPSRQRPTRMLRGHIR